MGPEDGWTLGIEGALRAHFLQPDGTSVPGIDWAVSLQRQDRTERVLVRMYFSGDLDERARQDVEYQGQAVLAYVRGRLDEGWTPEDADDLVFTLGDAPDQDRP
jgi:hypothetical protein